MEHADQYREWEQLLNECNASGQTVKAFCSEHNITEYRYYYWRKKIMSRQSAQAGFTELVNLPDQRILLEIEVDRVRVSLYQPVNTAYVSSLLKFLRKV